MAENNDKDSHHKQVFLLRSVARYLMYADQPSTRKQNIVPSPNRHDASFTVVPREAALQAMRDAQRTALGTFRPLRNCKPKFVSLAVPLVSFVIRKSEPGSGAISSRAGVAAERRRLLRKGLLMDSLLLAILM